MDKLSVIEEKIMAETQSDWCINYKWLTHIAEKPELQKAIKHLKELGYIEYYKGLMNEDGEMGGAGWLRADKGGDYIEEYKL